VVTESVRAGIPVSVCIVDADGKTERPLRKPAYSA
jgi:hypothetical protein